MNDTAHKTSLEKLHAERQAASKRRAKTVAMTPAQLRTLERIREKMLNSFGSDHEWKSWDVTIEAGGRLAVIATVGAKGDEGSYAAIFCRDSWLLFIGRGGGLSALNDKCKRVRGWRAFYTGHRS